MVIAASRSGTAPSRPSSMERHVFWWQRTWLLAESTLTISLKSLITICRRYRKTSSIEWDAQEGLALQALLLRSFLEWSVLTWPELSALYSSRCVGDMLIPVLRVKNVPCRWTSPVCGQNRISLDPGWFAFPERSFSGIRSKICKSVKALALQTGVLKVFGGNTAKDLSLLGTHLTDSP